MQKNTEQKIEQKFEIDEDLFRCPISFHILRYPILLPDGKHYEAKSIHSLLARNAQATCPNNPNQRIDSVIFDYNLAATIKKNYADKDLHPNYDYKKLSADIQKQIASTRMHVQTSPVLTLKLFLASAGLLFITYLLAAFARKPPINDSYCSTTPQNDNELIRWNNPLIVSYNPDQQQPVCAILENEIFSSNIYLEKKRNNGALSVFKVPDTIEKQMMLCMDQKFDRLVSQESSLEKSIHKIKHGFVKEFYLVIKNAIEQDLTFEGTKELAKFVGQLSIRNLTIDSSKCNLGSGCVSITTSSFFKHNPTGILGFDFSKKYTEKKLRQAANNVLRYFYSLHRDNDKIFIPFHRKKQTKPGQLRP